MMAKAHTFGTRPAWLEPVCGWLTDTLRFPPYDDLAGWFERKDPTGEKSARTLAGSTTTDDREEWLPFLLPDFLSRSCPANKAEAERYGAPWAWGANSPPPAWQSAWRLRQLLHWEDDEKAALAGVRTLIEGFAALAEPVTPREAAAALARLLAVVDQTMPEAMAHFCVEMLAASQAPAAAVWHLMEHIARTESGKVKPATFHAPLAAVTTRRQALHIAAVVPAREMLREWDQAYALATGSAGQHA